MIAIDGLARSKAEAKAESRKIYFTGEPCRKGHISVRRSSGHCIECMNIVLRKWVDKNPEKRWDLKHPEKARIKQKRWRENNTEKARAAVKRWEKANPEKKRAAAEIWVKANPEKVRQKYRTYADRHPEMIGLKGRRRRARELAAPGSHTIAELTDLRKKTGNRCAGCNGKRKLTIDHIMALSKGGSDAISNIQFLCLPCNAKKNNKDPIDFNRSFGRLL